MVVMIMVGFIIKDVFFMDLVYVLFFVLVWDLFIVFVREDRKSVV